MSTSSEVFLDRYCDLRTVEVTVRNKFKWSWLEERDSNGDFLSAYLRKIPEAGIGYCLFCSQRLHYASRGKAFIIRHALSKYHVSRRNEFRSRNNQSLLTASLMTQSLKQGQDFSARRISRNQKHKTSAAEVKSRPMPSKETAESQDQGPLLNDNEKFDFLSRNDLLLDPKIEMDVDSTEHSASFLSADEEEQQSPHTLTVLQNAAHNETSEQENSPSANPPSFKTPKVEEETEGNHDSQPVRSINDERHMLFLRSLLPSLRQLDEEQTLEFHMGVLKLLQDIRKQKPASSGDDNDSSSSTGPMISWYRGSQLMAPVKCFTSATAGNPQNKCNN